MLATLLLALQGEKSLPPSGIAAGAADRSDLQRGLAELARDARGNPDVEIYVKAVRYALEYDEFFSAKEVDAAKALLKQGLERARGKAPTSGMAGFGYRSKIDGSAQPYGLWIPAGPRAGPRRLDIWMHGRDEKLTDLAFLSKLRPGPFTPPDAYVLVLYGRFCCANKFAGEVDCFEALADARRRFPIDENRIVLRGFSMGGASCWHLAAHHAGVWVAAAPGAGFAESAQYLGLDPGQVPEYRRKLWHLYDATDYAANLANCTVIAYSGEIDKQKQAADVMARAMEAEGLKLVHLIGPKTGHAYHPETKKELERLVDAEAARGREPTPKRLRFTTWTLRYDRMRWVQVEGLERHWERARVDAELEAGRIVAKTENVSELAFSEKRAKVSIDGQELDWAAHYRKLAGRWEAGELAGLRKRHGLQGPIDDAFMDSFLMVRPSGKPGAWVAAEMDRQIQFWRRFFRGDARVVEDRAVTAADIEGSNLILWGDPGSNSLVAKIAAKIPAKWSDATVPVLIYPNPLNPKKYVVLNSGPTFRAVAAGSNAAQIPMLPDHATLDARTGQVLEAGFFDEAWK